MNTKLIDRIQKLLSLATSPNEHEAKLAAAKANEMLVKHNLSISDVELQARTDDSYENREVGTYKVMPFEARWVIKIMDRHFFVKSIYREARRYKVSEKGMAKVWFVGEKTNVEVASYVFQFLVNKYKQLWKEYQSHNGLRHELKGAYYEGLTAGLSYQLSERRKDVESSMALVVVDDPNLQRQMEKYFPKLGTSSLRPMVRDDEIASDGFAKGKDLHIARGIEKKDGGAVQLALAHKAGK